MSERLATDDARATFVGAPCGQETGTIVPEKVWFALLAKALWPVKAAIAIEQYAGCPDRTARAYTSGDREPPASVLRDLLRGDEGYRVLSQLMDGCPVAWWGVIQRERKLAALANEIFERVGVLVKQ